MSDINITPMVDVMLVLLIVFMVAAPLMTSGISVHLPSSHGSKVAKKSDPLRVTLTEHQKVFLDKTPIDPQDLTGALEKAKKQKDGQGTEVFLLADQDLNYGFVMQVMSAIHDAGLSHISLITTPSTASQEKHGPSSVSQNRSMQGMRPTNIDVTHKTSLEASASGAPGNMDNLDAKALEGFIKDAGSP